MLFFFSCTISSTPQTNPTIESDLQGMNHHLQSIELLSNQLLEAEEQQNTEKAKNLYQKIQEENNALQRQKQLLMEHLKAKPASSQSSSNE